MVQEIAAAIEDVDPVSTGSGSAVSATRGSAFLVPVATSQKMAQTRKTFHWIGVKEHVQDTSIFDWEKLLFPINFPFNQSVGY